MGSVFRKAVTRPLPKGAEFITRQGVRLARWKDFKGKTRTALVTTGRDGAERIREESKTYFARHRGRERHRRRDLDRMPHRGRRTPGARRRNVGPSGSSRDCSPSPKIGCRDT